VRTVITLPDGNTLEIKSGEIVEPYAGMLRSRQITRMDVYYTGG
jgi:hypothetical protein